MPPQKPEVAIKNRRMEVEVLVVVAYPDVSVAAGAVHGAEPEDGHLCEAHITIEKGSIDAVLWVRPVSQRDGRA